MGLEKDFSFVRSFGEKFNLAKTGNFLSHKNLERKEMEKTHFSVTLLQNSNV
jgi:hypothetical protein